MSAKLYVMRYQNSAHIITIANSYDEAKLIFKREYNREPSEISIFDKSCYMSIGVPCEWCQDPNNSSNGCNCSTTQFASPL